MWEQLSSYKNHFLQKNIKHLKKQTINELVHNEFALVNQCRGKCKFSLAENCDNSKYFAGTCQHSSYLEDHTQLAYGFEALPKLLKELCSDDMLTRWRAVNTLSEFLLNPLHAQRAIEEYDIVRRAYNVFMNIRTVYVDKQCLQNQTDPREISKLLRIFYILSLHLNGAQKLSRKPFFLEQLYKMIFQPEPQLSTQAAQILRNLSEKTEIVLYMLENTTAYNCLEKIFKKDILQAAYDEPLWQHLSHFLEIAPHRGVELGFFELLYKRIVCRVPRYHCLNMKCFALLLTCAEGQKCFDEFDGVLLLYEILAKTKAGLDTYEYILCALMNGLNSKKSIWRCHEFTELPLLVLECSQLKKRQTVNLQLYMLQVFKQMSVMPAIKNFVLKNCLSSIRKLKCLSEFNECLRDELVNWLLRNVYDSAPINAEFIPETAEY